MTSHLKNLATTTLTLSLMMTSLCAPTANVFAASVALATSPLATSTTTSVKPNLLFILDNSGSMEWDHMPDDSSDGGSAVTFSYGFYGLRSSQCNQVYYNPAITYHPPVYADGTSYPNASFTAAWTNGFNTGSGTLNLSTSFKASITLKTDATGQPAYYYLYSGAQDTPQEKNYQSVTNTFYNECRNDTGITYSNGDATTAAPASGVGGVFTKVVVSAISGIGGTDERTNFANWYSYYRTRMLMMKTASGRAFNSVNNTYRVGMMKISSSTPVVYMDIFEGTHRSNWYSTLYNMVTSGSTPLRRSLSDAGRYYAGKLGVTDPVQYSCQQNFTILSTDGYWNTGDGYQINGSTAIGNQDGAAGRPMYDGSSASTTVTVTYQQNVYYCRSDRNQLYTAIQTGSCSVPANPGTASCVPSSWIPSSATRNDTYLGSCSLARPTNRQEVSRVISPPTGGSSNSLADVAMYYYQTDLRTPALSNCTGALGATENVCTNNVFIGSNDNNLQQHMTTFTLGLGASGWMNYSSSYLSDSSGDYVAVKLGSTASASVCTWQTIGTSCNWPLPGMTGSDGLIANIDDLWHAAVNGRGAYFSATDPTTLATGLSNALAGINARKGAAAAAATSTLNPVSGNNFAYVASYTTVKWQGNLEARAINVDTGVVNENATWCVEDVAAGTCASPSSIFEDSSSSPSAFYCRTPNSITCAGGELNGTDCLVPMPTACTGTMNTKVADTSDTRTIWTSNSVGSGLIAFDSSYASANPSHFSSTKLSALSQWPTLTTAQQSAATGSNLINYLRGQNGYEDRTTNVVANRLYRYREAVLGDAIESQPAFIGAPVFSYPYTGYSSYLTDQAARSGTVYMGANDGMMHAFAADTGIERWAYVPSMVIPNMWRLADFNYATLHTNFVNGSPTTSDIYCTANCGGAGGPASWRTILVAGLNGGGRGYYALDITNPSSPTLLWEFTPTTGNGAIKDDDVGYGFGQPVIARKADGTWVVLVTSGYNNSSPGTGIGYLYVLNASTGAIISKISTGTGSIATPSGLSKIAVWNNEPGGNLAGYIYGGDLLGNVWRFDINSATPATIGNGTVLKFATLFSDNGGSTPQPITTVPILGSINGKRVVFIGTGKYLESSDLSNTQIQTQYAIKDDEASTTLINPRNSLIEQTLSNNPDGTATRIPTNNSVNFYSGRGWYVDYPDSGERVNIDSKLVAGTLITSTIVPSNTVCSPGGYGWLNYFNYSTGGAVNAPSNTTASTKVDAPIVGVNVLYIEGTPQIRIVTSTNPTPSRPSGGNLPFGALAGGFTGKRVLWRELIP